MTVLFPPVLPAPMCDITDYPFREIYRQTCLQLTTLFPISPLTYTPMVSAVGLAKKDNKSLKLLDLHPSEQSGKNPVAIQIFGAEPNSIAQATQIVDELGAVIIDLNMGCPATKVTDSQAGSALLKNLPLAKQLFHTMRKATSKPLTVKMRWDWSDTELLNKESAAALVAAQMAQDEGFNAVCLHARTRAQGYSGKAQWEWIAQLKQKLSIPVIGNGDIWTPEDAIEMMQLTRCDAFMIGRACMGAPWLAAQCMNKLYGETPPIISDKKRQQIILNHATLMYERDPNRGLILFRKHAAAYLRGLRGAKRLRERIMQTTTIESLISIFTQEFTQENSIPLSDFTH